MKEIIEKIAEIIHLMEGDCNCDDRKLQRSEIAHAIYQEILTAKYPCPVCKGSKIIFDERNDRKICSICNGTGDSDLPLVIETCTDQAPPENPYNVEGSSRERPY